MTGTPEKIFNAPCDDDISVRIPSEIKKAMKKVVAYDDDENYAFEHNRGYGAFVRKAIRERLRQAGQLPESEK